MKEIKIYSDGGSINNGGKDPNKPVWGSYATLIVNSKNQIVREFLHIEENVTNNQMELRGGLHGIRYMRDYMRQHCPNEKIALHIYSDSQYLIKGGGEWIFGWQRKGWKNSSKKTVENLDLWKQMWEFLNDPMLELHFHWVKGHVGKKVQLNENADIYFNELCDSKLSALLDEKRLEM